MTLRSLFLPLLAAAALAPRLHAQVPKVTSISPEEPVSSSYMEHPAIATDSRGQPHFVADFGVGNNFMKFHRVNGRWGGGVFASGTRGGRYNASRLYIGQIEIDEKNRAWISCKMGVKEWGSMYGQGLWLFRNVDQDRSPAEQFFRFVCVYKGMGVVSTDTKYPDEGVMLGTFGNWERVDHFGKTLGSGSINGGHGGEKVRFRIASFGPRFGGTSGYQPDGIWHTAMNGFSSSSSKYQNNLRYKAGEGPVDWAKYSSYPQQGDDYSHPGLGIDLDNPRISYIGCVFGRRLVVNVWDGTRLLFNPYSLKVLDYEATFEGRHSVQFAPALSGGVFVFWSSDNLVKMCYLSQNGHSTPPEVVATGRSPAATSDRYGNMHLVYYNNGIKYRKLLVSTLRPIEPKNRVSATRTPRFHWTSTRSATYSVQLIRDGVKLPAATCASNTWVPPSDLKVGSYTWRVKEGRPDSKNHWSKTLAFEIPPAMPAPVSPDSRYPTAPVKPLLAWNACDPAATKVQVQLFDGSDLLDTVTATGGAVSVKWNDALPAGEYSWRARAIRGMKDYPVESAWSPLMKFQVAVPGATRLTDPNALATYEPGWTTVTCAWTTAEGAETYLLKVLFNGETVDKENVNALQHPLSKAFQPGYYSVLVRPMNGYGNGPWSPARTFIVKRQMAPGNGSTTAGSPRAFEWTRNRGATRYLLKVARYDRADDKFKVILEKWIRQPASGSPVWTPAAGKFTAGAYRWSVTDYEGKKQGYTSVEYFQVRVPGAPLLLTPLGTAAGLRQLPFAWEDPSAFADQFQLRLTRNGKLFRDTGWMDAIDLVDEGSAFSRALSFDDTETGSFTWSIRSRNSYGSGPWKQATFNLSALPAPVITAPGASFGAVGTPVPVTWEPVAGASRYEVSVQLDGQDVESQELVTTGWTWVPEQAGSYTIRVRSGECGWSRWTTLPFVVTIGVD